VGKDWPREPATIPIKFAPQGLKPLPWKPPHKTASGLTISRARHPIPTIPIIWHWRMQFLNGLWSTAIETRPSVFFNEHLRQELMPAWQRVAAVAPESEPVSAATLQHDEKRDIERAEIRRHTWYLKRLHMMSPTMRRDHFPSFHSPERAKDRRVLDDCWELTVAFLRKWHLDGYETGRGNTANVPWVREVLFHTLDSWTQIGPASEEFPYVLPLGVWEIHRSGGLGQHVRKDFTDPVSESLLKMESQDTSFDRGSAEQFFATDNRWTVSLPTWSGLEPIERWKFWVRWEFDMAVEKHLAQRAKLGRSCNTVFRGGRKRSPRHIKWLIAYQVLGMSYKDARDEQAAEISTIQNGVWTTSALLGIPLRKGSKGGRPRKNTEPPAKTRKT
jgi:hypothetical protein